MRKRRSRDGDRLVSTLVRMDVRGVMCVCFLFTGAASAAGFEATIGASVERQLGNVPNQPGGSVDSAPSEVPDTLRGGLRVDLGARLGRWFFGPLGELGFAPNCSLPSCYYYRVGAGARFHFAPEAPHDPWVGVAAVWELLGYKSGTNPGIPETQHGPSGVLQIGVDLRWEGIRVAPVLGISAGAYHIAGRDTAHGGISLGLTFTL